MKRFFCFAAVLLSLMLISCQRSVEDSFFALDTIIELNFDIDGDAENALSGCRELISVHETALSKTKEGGALYSFNVSSDGIDSAPSPLVDTLSVALKVAKASGGAYDPTLGSLISLWGIGTENAKLPSQDEISTALESCGYENVSIEYGASVAISKTVSELSLDLGGAGKGYIAQATVQYLKTQGALRGVLSFGGNIAVFGEKADGSPYRIAIRDPKNNSDYVGYVKLIGENYVSVSGAYERYSVLDGKHYHHILDPFSGYPSTSGLASVAVVSKDGALADCLSTALFVLGYDAGIKLYESGEFDFEAIFIFEDESIICTRGIEKDFVLSERN